MPKDCYNIRLPRLLYAHEAEALELHYRAWPDFRQVRFRIALDLPAGHYYPHGKMPDRDPLDLRDCLQFSPCELRNIAELYIAEVLQPHFEPLVRVEVLVINEECVA